MPWSVDWSQLQSEPGFRGSLQTFTLLCSEAPVLLLYCTHTKKEGNTPFHIHVCRLFLPGHLIPLNEVGLDLLQKSKTSVLYCMQTVEVWVSLAPLCSLGFHPQMFVVFKLLTVLTKASPMPVKAHRWERDNCKLYILCFEMINPRLCLSWQLR